MKGALNIIGQIYDAAAQPDLWPDVLNAVADASGAWAATLLVCGSQDNKSTIVSPRGDMAAPPEFHIWEHRDPCAFRYLRDRSVGILRHTREQIGRDDYKKTEYFQSYVRKYSDFDPHSLSALLTADRSFTMRWVMHSKLDQDVKPETEVRFKALLPHLSRSAQIYLRLRDAEIEKNAALLSRGAPAVGLAVVDAAMRVLFADDGAEGLFSKGDVVTAARSALTVVNSALDAECRRLVGSCAFLLPGRAAGGSVQVRRKPPAPALKIEVVPFRFSPSNAPFSIPGLLKPDALLIFSEVAAASNDDMAQKPAFGEMRIQRLIAIKEDIKANLAFTALSLDWVAARHNISTAYVRSLFRTESLNFTDFVLQSRLELAYSLLCDPLRQDTPITVIAIEAGFSDLSWFNQSFRRSFQMTPSEVRAKVLHEGAIASSSL